MIGQRGLEIQLSSACDALEKSLDAIQPRTFAWTVVAIALLQRTFKCPEQYALLVSQIHRRLDHDAAEQVTGFSATYGFDAFFFQTENPPGLSFGRDFQYYVTLECRHLYRTA